MKAYQFNESKAFPFVDKNLSWLPILGKQPFKVFIRYIGRQIPHKQTAALRIRLLPGPPQKRQIRFKTLRGSKAGRSQPFAAPQPAGEAETTPLWPQIPSGGLAPRPGAPRPRCAPRPRAPPLKMAAAARGAPMAAAAILWLGEGKGKGRGQGAMTHLVRKLLASAASGRALLR